MDASPLTFIVERDREPGDRAPTVESVWCVRDAARSQLAGDLAVGAGEVGGRPVDHGFGVDVWELDEGLVARVAAGWRAMHQGDGETVERFLISRDGGASWLELASSDARDLEHRRIDERRLARIDRWPGSWC